MQNDIKTEHGEALWIYTGIDDRMYFYCGGCEHVAEVKALALLTRFGDLTDWSPIREKMVCKKCEHRGGYFKVLKLGGYRAPRSQANE